MKKNLEDIEIEKIITKYYSDIFNIKAYRSKILYYGENKNKIKSDLQEEIEKIEEIITKINFKNKYIETLISGMADEQRQYIELKYRDKLKPTEIENKMFIKDRTYYRTRRKTLDYLKSLLL